LMAFHSLMRMSLFLVTAFEFILIENVVNAKMEEYTVIGVHDMAYKLNANHRLMGFKSL
jgi:hypothetical protein